MNRQSKIHTVLKASAANPKSKIRILVVEDNEKNMYLIRFILKKNGYEVIDARNGEDAVRMAISEKPDLILMDIQLPGIGGLEATRRIRKLETGNLKLETGDMQPQSSIVNHQSSIHRVPIIALTSFAMAGDKEKALAAGCMDYIEKPINTETFIAKIEKYL